MTPRRATDEEIRTACMTRGSNDAARHLRSLGLTVNESRATTIISRMIANGEREKIVRPATHFNTRDVSVDISRNSATIGCNALLRAHLRAGRHWITDPARFADACASVGLSA